MAERIKKPTRAPAGRIVVTPEINYDDHPPIFSLERLQNGRYCFSKMDVDHKASFAEAIFKRRNTSWAEIKKTGRHKLGFEKIDRKSISAPIPKFITEEVDHFLAFRFSGMKPMVGYRLRDVFYVLWFDSSFDLYPH